MSRKTYLTLLLIGIFLLIFSFTLGIFYERWQESKNSLNIDHSLTFLIAKASDFEIAGGEWSHIRYSQFYMDPTINKGRMYEYEDVTNNFTAYFPTTQEWFSVEHKIFRYAPGEMPSTTWIDDGYLGEKALPEIKTQMHLLNLKELDNKTRAFCISSGVSTSITCFIESKYANIISTFSIHSTKIKEEQLVEFITPAIQKFYDRLSKSSIK